MNPVGHRQQQPAFEFDTGRGESGYGISRSAGAAFRVRRKAALPGWPYRRGLLRCMLRA
jgi:hypothetical protein